MIGKLVRAKATLSENDPQDYENAYFEVDIRLNSLELSEIISLIIGAAVNSKDFELVKSAVDFHNLLAFARTAGRDMLRQTIDEHRNKFLSAEKS